MKIVKAKGKGVFAMAYVACPALNQVSFEKLLPNVHSSRMRVYFIIFSYPYHFISELQSAQNFLKVSGNGDFTRQIEQSK